MIANVQSKMSMQIRKTRIVSVSIKAYSFLLSVSRRLFDAIISALGYTSFIYIVFIAIFGGEFHVKIYWDQGIQAAKDIWKHLTQ